MNKIWRKGKIALLLIGGIAAISLLFGACSGGKTCNHSWNEGVIAQEPTCTADGEKTFSCDLCGETKKEKLDKTTHEFSGNWLNTDPEGHYHLCVNCNTAKDEVVPHEFVNGEVIEQPTYTEEGIIRITCSVCGYQSTKLIPVPEHSGVTEWSKDDTYHWHACADHQDCGVRLDKTEHSYLTELTEQNKPATCKDDGYSVWQCVCGAIEKRTISKETVAHTWNEGEITKEPTCSAEGEKTLACTVCGQTKTVAVPVAEHSYSEEWSHNSETHWKECSCGAKAEEAAHIWGEGVVTQKPTLTENGERTYTCLCGETKIEEIAAQADFRNDFTVENQDGAWKYGSVEYQWGESEDFTFNAATETTADAWKANGVEIKAGWISADSMTTIGYTASETINITLTVNFKGDTENTRVALRIGVKNSEGVIYSNPSFDKTENTNMLSVTKELTLNAGDTIYFIFSNESGGVEGAFPNGELDITLIRKN